MLNLRFLCCVYACFAATPVGAGGVRRCDGDGNVAQQRSVVNYLCCIGIEEGVYEGMNLAEYLAHSGKSRYDFAAEIGVRTQSISLWIRGERWPTGPAMRRIRNASDNQVSADHMLDAHTP